MISSNNHSLIEKKIGAADSRPKNQENDWSIPEIFFIINYRVFRQLVGWGRPESFLRVFRKRRNYVFGYEPRMVPERKEGNKVTATKPHIVPPPASTLGPLAPVHLPRAHFGPLAPVHLLKALFGPLAPCAPIPKHFGSLAPCFNSEHISASLAPVLPPEAPWPRPRASSVLWWSWIYTHAVKIKPIYGEIHTIRKLHWINAPRAYIFICMIEPWRGLSPVIF